MKPTSSQSAYRPQSERITQPSQIIALLRRIEQSRNFVRLRIPGTERYYNSLLLKVDTDHGYLLLDEINDDQAHELLLQEGSTRIFAECEGVEMNFACNIHSVQNRKGIRFYRSPLPDYINYLQRRSDYRVHVGMDMEISVLLPISEHDVVDGQLCDLSMGGLGARLANRRVLHKGLIIPDCRIRLPQTAAPVHAELEIRFIIPDRQHQNQRVGGRFVNLNSEDRTRLRRFVMQLEREMIRRKSRDKG